MTIKILPVCVKWQSKRATSLPEGKQYITVAKFNEDLHWEKNAWSVVLEFTVSPKLQGNPSLGSVRFLMESAPHDRLTKGCQFELYEGKDLVATSAHDKN